MKLRFPVVSSLVFAYLCVMFVRKVVRYINEKRLLDRGDKVLVALSGGADSVALLRVLLQEGYACVAAHCNFRLRGEEADRDEAFVRSLCGRLDVPFHVKRFDTRGYAAGRRISVEMAARELRYGWFEELRVRTGARKTAVAHHRDDSVETFLLNLIRGTGIGGLRGMAASNGAVVRPLLDVSRKDILDYLESMEQAYVTDSTNQEDEFIRNKIRLNVIPLLQEINPSVCDSILETASRLGDAEVIYRRSVLEACRRVKDAEGRISIARLQAEASPRAVLFELLHPLGFNASQLKDIYRSLSGESGRVFLSEEYELLRDRACLLVRRRNQETGTPVLHTEIKELDASFVVPRDRRTACLDADKAGEALELRKWRSGDCFVPFGMKGFKRVRDYLRDRKFSLFQKEQQYVVTSGKDIVWLVNERPDDRFRVTEHTRRVLILSVEMR